MDSDTNNVTPIKKKRGITVQARHQARLLEVGSYPRNTEVASRATQGMAVVPRNRGVQQDGVKECAEMRERCRRTDVR